MSWYQKRKPIWILLKQETVSGSGISWAICKLAPCSRQITVLSAHHQHPTTQFFTGQMPFLPPNQQRQITVMDIPHCMYGEYLACSQQNQFCFVDGSSSAACCCPYCNSLLDIVTRCFQYWCQNVPVQQSADSNQRP